MRMLLIGMIAVAVPAGANAQAGTALTAGMQLVYESGGVAQEPWIYDSVAPIAAPEFEQCLQVHRRGQPARQYCVRRDSLFDRSASGAATLSRPIGAQMRAEMPLANRRRLIYETGARSAKRVSDVDLVVVETIVTTIDSTGTVVRRLREQYAPALLTAVQGIFEEPDSNVPGGWRITREFRLTQIHRRRDPRPALP